MSNLDSRRNNYNDLLLKIGAIFLILYRQWVGQLSEYAFVCVLFTFFATQFILRARHNSNISPFIYKFELAWSSLTFWLSFILALRASTGMLFQGIFTTATISIVCLLVYICLCFEVSGFSKELNFKIEQGKDPDKIQRRLESLSFLFNRYQANEDRARLLLGGYIEQIQRDKDIEQNCPLLFEKVWSEEKKFSSYITQEKQAFLQYLSQKYLTALKK